MVWCLSHLLPPGACARRKAIRLSRDIAAQPAFAAILTDELHPGTQVGFWTLT